MRWDRTLWAALLVPVVAIAPALAQTGDATGKKVGATAGASGSAAAQPGVAPAAASAAVSTGAAPAGGSAPAGSAGAGGTASGKVAASAPVGSAGPALAGPTAAARPAASGAGGMDGATYAVRLKDLEQRIDELKEQIRRSHTRLSLLTDTILSGGLAGSRSELQFQNDMSNAFKLVRALFVLDGAVQYNKADDTGALADQKEIPIFSGSIPPGDHTVQILLQFQGNGYGVFSYLKGYHFEARSSHSFTAVEGKTISLQIIAYEKGGVTTPLEERPAVRFAEKISAGMGGGNGAASAPGKAASGQPAATAGQLSAGTLPSANVQTGVSVGTGSK